MDIDIQELIQNGPKYFLQNVSVDNVIFGYHEKELKILLQRPQGLDKWLLPGGYIFKTETIQEAANRIAQDRTGLNNIFLNQFQVFGDPNRNKDSNFTPEIMDGISQFDFEIDENHWMFDYFVSVGFYALTEFTKVTPNGSYYAEECTWWSIDKIPEMLFDHNTITREALKSLRLDIYHFPIGYNLLPEKFTLPEIHSLYETILGKKLDSRNFSKKLVSTGIIKKLDERRKIGAHRSPFLYIFDNEIYNKALKNGLTLII